MTDLEKKAAETLEAWRNEVENFDELVTVVADFTQNEIDNQNQKP
jgi:hypothetical protein